MSRRGIASCSAGGVLTPCVLAAWALCSSAAAETAPFVDASLSGSRPCSPELIVARERTSAIDRRQSLYIRLFDPVCAPAVATGRLTVSGVMIVEVLWRPTDIATTDAVWGIQAAYAGPGRGLEGADPLTADPSGSGDDDALRVGRTTVDFYLRSNLSIDDLRVVVEHPENATAASFDLRLHHAADCSAGCGPQRWPPGDTQGFVVGQIEPSRVPDDGVFSGVVELRGVRLLVEDVDVGASSIDFGLAAPGMTTFLRTLVVDNFAGGVDLEGDNGFDLNGPFGRSPGIPFPANVDLQNLRYQTSALVGRAGAIPPSSVRLSGAPASLAVGTAATAALAVDVPSGTAPGTYTGTLTVREENDGGGPFTSVALSVTVGEIPDAGLLPDAGLPDGGEPDAGPVDAGPPDAGSIDAGVQDAGAADAGPSEDAGLDAGIADAGEGDAGIADAGRGPFGRLRGGGCRCATHGGSPTGSFLLLVIVALTLARRRRRERA